VRKQQKTSTILLVNCLTATHWHGPILAWNHHVHRTTPNTHAH